MTENETTYYHFVSCGRQGLATAIKNKVGGDRRAQIDVTLNVVKHVKGSDKTEPDSVRQSVQLFGPGDVVGFDERIVVRTDPKPNTGNFEPNYFPAIEFAEFDFPWRFSAQPAESGGLAPWIVLIVLIAENRGEDVQREYEELERRRNQQPAIRVFSQESLPDLKYAWRWAHVQATSGQSESEFSDNELRDLIRTRPERVVSRLLCPRRLQPKTLYTAFVVPAFKLGWAAGLDTDSAHASAKASSATDPAWDQAADTLIELPYYYRWDFRTSVRGDFEHLVRLLEPRKLEDLGLRDMDCAHPGFGLTAVRVECDDDKKHILSLEGALQSLDTERKYTPWGKDRKASADDTTAQPEPEVFQNRLAVEVLNKANADRVQLSLPETFDPQHRITHLAFDVLPDGKSLKVEWRTATASMGQFEYGPADRSGALVYSRWVRSDRASTRHKATIKLAPETMYNFRIVQGFESSDSVIRAHERIAHNGLLATGNGTIRIPLPAVVPPIYGRWHRARQGVVSDAGHNGWLDVLNLDPRHRAAAGFGAEVVRKEQEALMASAWDQIGEIEAANDLLRRAQLGRETGNLLHDRFGAMAMEDFLRATAPVQKRILRTQRDGSKITYTEELRRRTRIPAAALDPAFRRIARARGPLRKRQGQRRTDMLRRIANGELRPAGEHPRIEGTPTPCEITHAMIRDAMPAVSFTGSVESFQCDDGECTLTIVLSWNTSNTIRRTASGDPKWTGNIEEEQGKSNTIEKQCVAGQSDECRWVFELGIDSLLYTGTAFVTVTAATTLLASHGAIMFEPEVSVSPLSLAPKQGSASPWRFCDGNISCDQVQDAMTAGVEGINTENGPGSGLDDILCEALDGFLAAPVKKQAQQQGEHYIKTLAAKLKSAIDPRVTIKDRVRRRLRLNATLAERFEQEVTGDPFDEVMAYPKYPQPMYESLRGLSESHVLRGVEKVRQNTIGLLEPNRRFLESYMVGLNHEFSGELLWRRYPTDQRGSYFRQFWDVSEYIPEKPELSEDDAPIDTVREALKDIRPIHQWRDTKLGENAVRQTNGEMPENPLILIIRGDLLQRYPNAVIYAVNARLEYKDVEDNGVVKWTGDFVPDLPEYEDLTTSAAGISLTLKTTRGIMAQRRGRNWDIHRPPTDPGSAEPIYPIFRGSLGADLVFLGFPFSAEDAESTATQTGKFFVFEERVTETRFGLDAADNSGPIQSSDDLSWGHFQLFNEVGKYLDVFESEIAVSGETWNSDTSAARRASMTFQKPVRLAVHADQMIPEQNEH